MDSVCLQILSKVFFFGFIFFLGGCVCVCVFWCFLENCSPTSFWISRHTQRFTAGVDVQETSNPIDAVLVEEGRANAELLANFVVIKKKKKGLIFFCSIHLVFQGNKTTFPGLTGFVVFSCGGCVRLLGGSGVAYVHKQKKKKKKNLFQKIFSFCFFVCLFLAHFWSTRHVV